MRRKILVICLMAALSGTACGKESVQEPQGASVQEAVEIDSRKEAEVLEETSEAEADEGIPEAKVVEKESVEAEQEEYRESGETSGEVNPDLKAFLDEYEAFMDKYVEFMEKYEDSESSADMLEDYLAIMKEYADFAQALEDYDSEKMSTADAAYYLDVTTRISKKMLMAVD